jgi:hypothetical protein
VWYGPHDAMTTLFSPVYPGAAKYKGELPETYQVLLFFFKPSCFHLDS